MPGPRDMSLSEVIQRAGLPPSYRVHWSKSRKADVVRAVQNEVLSFHEARSQYLLSRSEFEQWKREVGPQPVYDGNAIDD